MPSTTSFNGVNHARGGTTARNAESAGCRGRPIRRRSADPARRQTCRKGSFSLGHHAHESNVGTAKSSAPKAGRQSTSSPAEPGYAVVSRRHSQQSCRASLVIEKGRQDSHGAGAVAQRRMVIRRRRAISPTMNPVISNPQGVVHRGFMPHARGSEMAARTRVMASIGPERKAYTRKVALTTWRWKCQSMWAGVDEIPPVNSLLWCHRTDEHRHEVARSAAEITRADTCRSASPLPPRSSSTHRSRVSLPSIASPGISPPRCCAPKGRTRASARRRSPRTSGAPAIEGQGKARDSCRPLHGKTSIDRHENSHPVKRRSARPSNNKKVRRLSTVASRVGNNKRRRLQPGRSAGDHGRFPKPPRRGKSHRTRTTGRLPGAAPGRPPPPAFGRSSVRHRGGEDLLGSVSGRKGAAGIRLISPRPAGCTALRQRTTIRGYVAAAAWRNDRRAALKPVQARSSPVNVGCRAGKWARRRLAMVVVMRFGAARGHRRPSAGTRLPRGGRFIQRSGGRGRSRKWSVSVGLQEVAETSIGAADASSITARSTPPTLRCTQCQSSVVVNAVERQ